MSDVGNASPGDYLQTIIDRTLRGGDQSMTFFVMARRDGDDAQRFLVTVVGLPVAYERLTKIFGEAVADAAIEGVIDGLPTFYYPR